MGFDGYIIRLKEKIKKKLSKTYFKMDKLTNEQIEELLQTQLKTTQTMKESVCQGVAIWKFLEITEEEYYASQKKDETEDEKISKPIE